MHYATEFTESLGDTVPAHNRLDRTVLVAAAAAAFAGAVQLSLSIGLLRARSALAAALLLALATVAFALRNSAARRRVGSGALAASLFAVVSLLPMFGQTPPVDGTFLYQWISGFNIWLMGWSLYLVAVASGNDGSVRLPRLLQWLAGLSTIQIALLIGALSVFISALARFLAAGHNPVIIDETLYILQSKLFGQPHFSLQFEEALKPFFMLRQSGYRDGGMFTQYPPGWPALLSVFSIFGLRWWASAIVGAICAVFTFLLGFKLHSRAAGFTAAMLVLFHPWFIGVGTPNTVSAAFLVLGAYFAFTGEVDQPPGWRWVGVGASLALVCAVRPLTGATATLSIALWYIIARRPSARRLVSIAWRTLAGAALPFAATFFFNGSTTGDPLTFGYTFVGGHLAALGFGERGLIHYSPGGIPRVIASDFTLVQALRNASWLVWRSVVSVMPVALMVPFLVAARRFDIRVDWKAVAVFMLLPLGYFFWYWKDDRYLMAIIPFAFIGMSAMLDKLRSRSPAIAMVFLVYLIVLVPVAALGSVIASRPDFEACRRTHEDVLRESERGRLLVFVKADPGGRGETLLECLYVLNEPGLSSPVVVARDLGAPNAGLASRYPGYRPVQVSWDGLNRKSVFEAIVR